MATPPAAARPSKPKPPPATLILLVRHGLTPTTGKVLPGRAPGLHLADQGRAQAEAVAERLAAWLLPSPEGAPAAASAKTDGRRRSRHPAPPAVGGIYASPLERTQETAAPIAKRLGVEISVEPGLLECDFGEWTGAELKALMKLPEWSTVQRYPSGFRFPGGESFEGLRARMAETVAELCRRHPGQVVVAVSHADPIKALVSDAVGAHLDLFQRVMVSPCSVTAIRYHVSGPTVLAVNWLGSLSEFASS